MDNGIVFQLRKWHVSNQVSLHPFIAFTQAYSCYLCLHNTKTQDMTLLDIQREQNGTDRAILKVSLV